jgi:hypothetical protein
MDNSLRGGAISIAMVMLPLAGVAGLFWALWAF